MRSKLLAALVGTFAAVLFAACSKPEPPPPPPATANDKAEPAEGTPRIAIGSDGTHVQYRVHGTAEPALVFIHGWSCDANYWREQVPVFKKKYTVVTVDLAGHGGTNASRSDWSMARFGQDVATAVATIPNRQIILVGHSMGGPVAIEAARLLKDRVVGIIGVDTFKSIGAPLPSAEQLDAIVKPFEANFIGHTREIVAKHFFPPGANQDLVGKVAYDMSLSPPQVAIPAMRAVLAYDFGPPLKEIDVPIVAINSDLGEPVNELRIRKVLPKFRAFVIHGDGHFLMMEDPARFNPALEAEVQGILNPATSK
jgi:pimeloyl-ACP methyl ester carboxylesterase